MTDLKMRATVSAFEAAIEDLVESGEAESAVDQATTEHYFTPTIEEYGARLYARTCSVPEGMSFTGKIHRYSHIVTLTKGKMAITSEDGRMVVTAPSTWVSPAGAKRAFHALEDSVLQTVHITKLEDETDLEKLEQEVIAPSFSSIGLEEPDYKLLE